MGKMYYNILGVPENCCASDIKKAYKQLALKHHPVFITSFRTKIQITKKQPKKSLPKYQKLILFCLILKKELLMIDKVTLIRQDLMDLENREKHTLGKIHSLIQNLIILQKCLNI
jgi:hypothetical protein